MTQSEKVVKHLAKYGSINSIEAIGLYRITRLAAVIHKLNKIGFITFANYAEDRTATYFPDRSAITQNIIRANLGKELVTR